ncbi:MAG TPA: leucyl aminopeptidase [Spirochaetota bacterium]|nr:leucyl aminopeptidase [Spirochaetota bacterium]
MKLTAREAKFDFTVRDTLALFLSEDFALKKGAGIPDQISHITSTANLGFFRAKSGESLFLPLSDQPSLIFAGLGKADEISRESLRNAAAGIIDICRKKKISTLHVLLPQPEGHDEKEVLSALAEGMYLGNYGFDRYKTRPDDIDLPLDTVNFYVTGTPGAARILHETAIVCSNTLLCRDLINETSERANPASIAAEAKKLAGMKGVSCTVLGHRELEKLGMGLLLAVGRAGQHPPRMAILRYRGNSRSKKSLAIVGKGITFDSGGLNLKPSGHIEDMRSDMAGAAACIYTIKAAAELGLKKNLYAVIPLCENMVAGNSYRPGDVYRAFNGITVEIGNTDAEGRLILADALAYTEKRLKPDFIIDIATLTGACLVCFGEIIAGLLSPSDELAEAVRKAGEETGERVWRLPLYKDYAEDLKSDMADMSNVSSTRNAGTIIGATFLNAFVESTPWAHIDIAGTSWGSKQRGYRPKNATGYGVRLFIEVIKTLAI